jgi:cell wall assembly regulator SMI1
MPGCDEDQLADAENRLGKRLPASVRSLYVAVDRAFDGDGQWWVVWRLDRLVIDNLSAWRDGRLDDSLLAFGDDGTGDPFCVQLDDDAHVVRWSFIDRAVVEDMTFDEFKSEWLPA